MSDSPEELTFDPELAWDIQEWSSGIQVDGEFTRGHIKNLAAFLTDKGYGKGKKSTGIAGLVTSIEEIGVKLADEVGPLIDSFRTPRPK